MVIGCDSVTLISEIMGISDKLLCHCYMLIRLSELSINVTTVNVCKIIIMCKLRISSEGIEL